MVVEMVREKRSLILGIVAPLDVRGVRRLDQALRRNLDPPTAGALHSVPRAAALQANQVPAQVLEVLIDRRRTAGHARQGSSATQTRSFSSSVSRSARPCSNAPPPARQMPMSIKSATISGGISSRASRTVSMITCTEPESASRISTEEISIVSGRPVTRLRPRTSRSSQAASRRPIRSAT